MAQRMGNATWKDLDTRDEQVRWWHQLIYERRLMRLPLEVNLNFPHVQVVFHRHHLPGLLFLLEE